MTDRQFPGIQRGVRDPLVGESDGLAADRVLPVGREVPREGGGEGVVSSGARLGCYSCRWSIGSLTGLWCQLKEGKAVKRCPMWEREAGTQEDWE